MFGAPFTQVIRGKKQEHRLLREPVAKSFKLPASAWAKLGKTVSQISEEDETAAARRNQAVADQNFDDTARQQLMLPSDSELGSGLAEAFSASIELRKASSRLSSGQILRFTDLAKELFGDNSDAEAALAGLVSIGIRACTRPQEFSLLPDFENFLCGKTAAEFCLPTGRRNSLEALGLVRVSYDAVRLNQAAQAFSTALPAELRAQAAALLEILLETVRRARCVNAPPNVSLSSAHIWGEDFTHNNLRFQLQGTAPNIRYGWLPHITDGGNVRHNRRSHFLAEQLKLKECDTLLRSAFEALLSSQLIVPAAGGGFVVDIKRLVFTDGREARLHRCRSCGWRQFPNVGNKCAAFRCRGELEVIPDDERRKEEEFGHYFRLYLAVDGEYGASKVKRPIERRRLCCPRK